MNRKRAVFWHQGMFLQPQHFQLTDQYHAEYNEILYKHAKPYFWGIISSDLRASGLSHRICDIENIQAVFEDGTYIEFPGNAHLSYNTIDEEQIELDKPQLVYLALRKLSAQGSNVTQVESEDELGTVNSRYYTRFSGEEYSDLYTDSEVSEVNLLNYNVKLVYEYEKHKYEQYQMLPVARFVKEGEALQLDTDYIAPVLTLGLSSTLMRIIKELRDELLGRSYQLDNYNTPIHGLREFDPNIMRYKLALRTLSRYVPRLFHYIETENVHPWDVYGVLCEIVGEVSTFTNMVNVLGEKKDGERLMPSYQHTDLEACFSAAKELILNLLNEITIGPQYLVDLEFVDDLYKTEIPGEFFEQNVDYYLVVNTGADFEEILPSLLTTAKIASVESVPVILERSLPGVGLIHAASVPPGLPRKANAYYMKLDHHDDMWASVSRMNDIAVSWADAPEDLELQLVILRK